MFGRRKKKQREAEQARRVAQQQEEQAVLYNPPITAFVDVDPEDTRFQPDPDTTDRSAPTYDYGSPDYGSSDSYEARHDAIDEVQNYGSSGSSYDSGSSDSSSSDSGSSGGGGGCD